MITFFSHNHAVKNRPANRLNPSPHFLPPEKVKEEEEERKKEDIHSQQFLAAHHVEVLTLSPGGCT